MKYLLKITERHCRHVIIDMDSKDGAKKELQEQYDYGDIYLDSDDLIESKISVLRKATQNDKLLYDGGIAKIENHTFDGYIQMCEAINEYLPKELIDIQKIWGEKSDAFCDVGTCVLGAGFRFKYKGLKYKMPPLTRCQGSVSWETFKDEIEEMLKGIGATDIEYDWGRMN